MLIDVMAVTMAYILPHLPTLYMATVLQNSGISVEIHDLAAHGKTAKDFYHFIDATQYDIYVFYTVFLSENTDLLARDYIRKRKNAKIIFTGTQPTWKPENFN